MSTPTMLALLAAQAPTGGGRGMTVMVIYIVAFIAIMYFLILRPQRKIQQKHQTMLTALKRGDEVVTEGGIIGSIVHLTDDRATLKTAENTRVVVARGKISRVVGGGEESS
ncbi:MAG: preprotein translocase subunit YajC [Longimicrobiales bacterium]